MSDICKLCHSREDDHDPKAQGCPVGTKLDGPTLYGPMRYFPLRGGGEAVSYEEWEQIRAKFNQEYYPHPCASCGDPLLNATKTAIYPHDGFICPDCVRTFREEWGI